MGLSHFLEFLKGATRAELFNVETGADMVTYLHANPARRILFNVSSLLHPANGLTIPHLLPLLNAPLPTILSQPLS